jgi:hypothetical protein
MFQMVKSLTILQARGNKLRILAQRIGFHTASSKEKWQGLPVSNNIPQKLVDTHRNSDISKKLRIGQDGSEAEARESVRQDAPKEWAHHDS